MDEISLRAKIEKFLETSIKDHVTTTEVSPNIGPTSPDAILKPVDIAIPMEDWMDDDFFTAIRSSVVQPEHAETITQSTEKLRKQGEYTRQHKIDSFHQSAHSIINHICSRIFSGSVDSFNDIVLPIEENEHDLMLFESLIDLCQQNYILPLETKSPNRVGTGFGPKRIIPTDPTENDQFASFLWREVCKISARMVLPDLALHAGRIDQEEIEQETVYDLAFQDVERNEEEWCDFKDSEKVLKEESVNVIWEDLVNEMAVELRRVQDILNTELPEETLGW